MLLASALDQNHPPSRHSESDVWHAGLPAAGLIRPSVPWCFVLRHRPWIRGVADEIHLQDAASNLEAGSAERQVNAMFAAIFYAFRK